MSASVVEPLAAAENARAREARYEEVLGTLASLLDGEDDWVAAMATVASELHAAFAYYDWTGFYRLVRPDWLVIGPYQGGHGCLRIHVSRGVCGAAIRTRQTQLVPDVHAFDGHIACSTSTRSEIVVPIQTPAGRLLGVLDVDSNTPAVFDETDQRWLERLTADLGRRFEATPVL